MLSLEWREHLSTRDMRALEINSEFLGIPTILLMENAGRSVAEVVASRTPRGSRVAVVAGKGGKAGDGFVAARHLASMGYSVEVILTSDPEAVRHEDARRNLAALMLERRVGISMHGEKPLRGFDALVDALLGTGIRGQVRGVVRDAIDEINSSGAPVYSIDTPSGLDPDTGEVMGASVRASVTVTLHAPKPGLLKRRDLVGELIVANIGIPAGAWEELGPGDIVGRVRPRDRRSKKGDNGRILVVGGSRSYVGAPWFAALGAWASGSDLVYLAAPEPVARRSFSPEIIPVELEGDEVSEQHVDRILREAGRCDAVAIGPGMGLSDGVAKAVPRILEELSRAGKPLVVDADALKILGRGGARLGWRAILTPHLGEAGHLLGRRAGDSVEERESACVEISSRYEAVVVLKGHVDHVCQGERVRRRSILGNPDMARGGTGDVLTGAIASLVPRTGSLFEAASAGTFLLALAGEASYASYGSSAPMNLIKTIPRVLRDPLSAAKKILSPFNPTVERQIRRSSF